MTFQRMILIGIIILNVVLFGAVTLDYISAVSAVYLFFGEFIGLIAGRFAWPSA